MDNNISFGWNLKTHSYITKKAYKKASKFTEVKLEKKILSIYSKMPDIDEIANLNEWHFFAPYFKYKKNDKNAQTQFIKYVEKSVKRLNEGKTDKASKHLGRALHYLQDIFMPLHAQKLSTKEKLAQLIKHQSFEDKAQIAQKEFINTKKEILIDETIKFKDFTSNLIKEKAVISRERIEQALSQKTENLLETIQVSLQEAFDSSYELIYRFSKNFTN